MKDTLLALGSLAWETVKFIASIKMDSGDGLSKKSGELSSKQSSSSGVTRFGEETGRRHFENEFQRKETAKVVPVTSLLCLDGSNIIGINSNLRTKVLQAIIEALRDDLYKCVVFVDNSIFGWLKKMHDERGCAYLRECEKNGQIIVAPNKAEADGQILQLAEFEKNAHIITNDRYRDYAEMHPWLNDRGVENRLHGVNVVPMDNGKSRILVAGFNLDITVQA